tara:strand:+ start:162 stop:263 length:102 start_codon:yes stop_codon:yes gene_type:complete
MSEELKKCEGCDEGCDDCKLEEANEKLDEESEE